LLSPLAAARGKSSIVPEISSVNWRRRTAPTRGATRVDGPGHWLQWEAPDTVNELLLDFLPR